MSELQMSDEELQSYLANHVANLPVDKRVKFYVKTREMRSELTKAFEAQDGQYKAILEFIESSLMADAIKQGVDGFKTEYGTTYTSETARYSVADEVAFTKFLDALPPEDARYAFFERRISSQHVKAYMEIHGGTLPPGLNQFREKVMRIRKTTNKKGDGS